MKKAHSYDVFDTCLVRTYAFPSDLFLDLGCELRPILEPIWGEGCAEIFRDTRVAAEARAISISDYEEVTLEEIWNELAKMIPELDVFAGVQKELELELKCLRSNPLVLSRVLSSRNQNVKIIFISDSYLPAEFIRDALIVHGFFMEGDGLYISSEYRLTKRSTNLFKYMLDKESLIPDDIIHYGDNAVTDVSMPLKCGIVSQQHVSTLLNTWEKALLTRVGGEQPFISKLVGGMRMFRLGELDQVVSSERSFVASFLGPFLLVLASWVLARAQREGVRRLYFLSRDCYALWRVASGLTDRFGGIDCRYLHVSRQALFLPTASEISPKGMPWMRRPFENPIVGNLLAKLELNISTAGAEFVLWSGPAGNAKRIVTDGDWTSFWELLNREPVRERIMELIKIRKAAAIQYFEDQGLLDPIEKSIVDLGWWLTCQEALNKLLKSKQANYKLRGYYLGLHTNRASIYEAGRANSLFYAGQPDRSGQLGLPYVFQRVTALEHVVGCAPHGTVHHYRQMAKKAEPLCASIDYEEAQVASRLVHLALQFSSQHAHLASSLASESVVRDILDRLITNCFSEPAPQWGQVVSKITVSIDQNNKEASRLAIPLRWADVYAYLLPKSDKFFLRPGASSRPWPEIDISISSEKIKEVIALKGIIRKLLQSMKKLSNVRLGTCM